MLHDVLSVAPGSGVERLDRVFGPEIIVVAAIRGGEVCGQMRRIAPHAGIIALVPGDGVGVRVSSLEAGADDCLTAPPHHAELEARVRAVRGSQDRWAGAPSQRARMENEVERRQVAGGHGADAVDAGAAAAAG